MYWKKPYGILKLGHIFSENEDENAYYVASESEHSGSPFKDSDNDIVDDDEVCVVPVEVEMDIHGFRVGSNDETNEDTDSEAETESLYSASDSETEKKRRRFLVFNSGSGGVRFDLFPNGVSLGMHVGTSGTSLQDMKINML
ncbi:hypothetical protein V6N13_138475 [Hibiscus sabdariffa]